MAKVLKGSVSAVNRQRIRQHIAGSADTPGPQHAKAAVMALALLVLGACGADWQDPRSFTFAGGASDLAGPSTSVTGSTRALLHPVRYYGWFPNSSEPRITIESATYESSAAKRVNAFSYVTRQCGGRGNCEITPTSLLLGDPDPNRAKILIIDYSCIDGDIVTIRVPELTMHSINCGR